MAMTPTEEIMMMGQRADVPMRNPNAPRPPQGGGMPRPPQGAGMPRPPQGGGMPRPPQGGGAPKPPQGAMEAMAALMGNEASLGSDMNRQMPEDSGQMMAEDAGALAEAVVGRAGGDVRGAIELLDNAKAMLVASAQKPQMAAMGKALKSVPENNVGLSKLPQGVRNNMGYMAQGGGLMRRGDRQPVGMYQNGGGIMSAEEAMRQLEAYRS